MVGIPKILSLCAVASLVVAPALCLEGLLIHPCETGHEAPCHRDTDCTGDPCNAVYLRPDGGTRLEVTAEPGLAPPLVSLHFPRCEEMLIHRPIGIDFSPPLRDDRAALAGIVLVI